MSSHEPTFGSPDYTKLNRGYDSAWEMLRDLLAILDLRIYLYYKYHNWVGPDNELRNMLGVVVTRDEFMHNMSKAALVSLIEHLTDDERRQLGYNALYIKKRLSLTEHNSFPLLRIIDSFELTEYQRDCLILAYSVYADKKYEKLYEYLQDDITQKYPTTALASRLFAPSDKDTVKFETDFYSHSSFNSLFVSDKLSEGKLVLQNEVIEYLSHGSVGAIGIQLFSPEDELPELTVRRDIYDELLSICASGKRITVSLSGNEGSGRRFLIKNTLAKLSLHGLFCDLGVAGTDEEAITKAVMLSRLNRALLCIYIPPELSDDTDNKLSAAFELLERSQPWGNIVFIVSEKNLHCSLGRVRYEYSLEPLETADRVTLFNQYMSGFVNQLDIDELGSKFHFTPRQIRDAGNQLAGFTEIGEVDSRLINKCCYMQVVHKLDSLASRIHPKYTWDDVVLPEQQKRLMNEACLHIKYSHRVYDTWGFSSKINYGKGLSLLFAGPPGTGKTMCAQVIANQLSMELYKIQISQVVSKYIGETEKNLQAVFAEAKNSNAILFFDECDALFSKRGEVKDSHDRGANIEVAYLLQQIEEYDGVCILATNLINNIDAAFMRRITYVIHFPFPDEEMRLMIYQHTLPEGVKVSEDVNLRFMAQKFQLTGGHIKNIVLNAAFMAAGEDGEIKMRQLLAAGVNELRKNEIVIVREDFAEYADLIDG